MVSVESHSVTRGEREKRKAAELIANSICMYIIFINTTKLDVSPLKHLTLMHKIAVLPYMSNRLKIL